MACLDRKLQDSKRPTNTENTSSVPDETCHVGLSQPLDVPSCHHSVPSLWYGGILNEPEILGLMLLTSLLHRILLETRELVCRSS